MDYKKLIKSRKLRIKIMQALSFVPEVFDFELGDKFIVLIVIGNK